MNKKLTLVQKELITNIPRSVGIIAIGLLSHKAQTNLTYGVICIVITLLIISTIVFENIKTGKYKDLTKDHKRQSTRITKMLICIGIIFLGFYLSEPKHTVLLTGDLMWIILGSVLFTRTMIFIMLELCNIEIDVKVEWEE